MLTSRWVSAGTQSRRALGQRSRHAASPCYTVCRRFNMRCSSLSAAASRHRRCSSGRACRWRLSFSLLAGRAAVYFSGVCQCLFEMWTWPIKDICGPSQAALIVRGWLQTHQKNGLGNDEVVRRSDSFPQAEWKQWHERFSCGGWDELAALPWVRGETYGPTKKRRCRIRGLWCRVGAGWYLRTRRMRSAGTWPRKPPSGGSRWQKSPKHKTLNPTELHVPVCVEAGVDHRWWAAHAPRNIPAQGLHAIDARAPLVYWQIPHAWRIASPSCCCATTTTWKATVWKCRRVPNKNVRKAFPSPVWVPGSTCGLLRPSAMSVRLVETNFVKFQKKIKRL